MKEGEGDGRVIKLAEYVVLPIVLLFLIALLCIAGYQLSTGAWIRHDCYVSPMGGAPVEAHSFHEAPYVCGDFESGYRCVKMKPCSERP